MKLKESTFKMVRTVVIKADAETCNRAFVDSSVAPVPLQAQSDGIEGGHAGKPTVRLMSMTFTPFPSCGCGGTGQTRPLDPVLTIEEAARMHGLSLKRLQNLISEEKARNGRLPEFVVDGGGRIRRLILKDEFLKWIKYGQAKKRGRPLKHLS